MITLEHVSKRYPGGSEALSELSLGIEKGEMVVLTGHSGAGKSTLLKWLALIERPTRGQVIVNGQNTAKVSRRRIPAYRRKIGMVFQDHKLLLDRTVFDNVALPLVIACVMIALAAVASRDEAELATPSAPVWSLAAVMLVTVS